MADAPQLQIPQMPSNAGIPGLNQAPVSGVAQTNPLMSLQQGAVQGASLGLQARQIAIQQQLANQQEQQRRSQMYAAQVQQQKNEEDFVTNAWDKIAHMGNVPAYQQHLIESITPATQKVMSRYGVSPDFTHEDFVNNDPAKKEAIALMSSKLPPEEKAIGLQAIHVKYPGETELGQSLTQMSDQLMKQKTMQVDQQKNQQKLAQDWVNGAESLKGDTVYKGLETQRNAAAQGYDTLKKNQKADGSYDLSNGQIIDLYGQLWKAQTGGVLSPAELDEMNQASAQKNYAKLAGYLGMSKSALPTAVGQRLETMFTNLGQFSDKQHSTMEQSKNAMPGGLTDPNEIAAAQKRLGRGLSFDEMKSSSDAASKYQPGKAAAKPGDVEDGYIYLGGDKKNPKSWKKQ